MSGASAKPRAFPRGLVKPRLGGLSAAKKPGAEAVSTKAATEAVVPDVDSAHVEGPVALQAPLAASAEANVLAHAAEERSWVDEGTAPPPPAAAAADDSLAAGESGQHKACGPEEVGGSSGGSSRGHAARDKAAGAVAADGAQCGLASQTRGSGDAGASAGGGGSEKAAAAPAAAARHATSRETAHHPVSDPSATAASLERCEGGGGGGGGGGKAPHKGGGAEGPHAGSGANGTGPKAGADGVKRSHPRGRVAPRVGLGLVTGTIKSSALSAPQVSTTSTKTKPNAPAGGDEAAPASSEATARAQEAAEHVPTPPLQHSGGKRPSGGQGSDSIVAEERAREEEGQGGQGGGVEAEGERDARSETATKEQRRSKQPPLSPRPASPRQQQQQQQQQPGAEAVSTKAATEAVVLGVDSASMLPRKGKGRGEARQDVTREERLAWPLASRGVGPQARGAGASVAPCAASAASTQALSQAALVTPMAGEGDETAGKGRRAGSRQGAQQQAGGEERADEGKRKRTGTRQTKQPPPLQPIEQPPAEEEEEEEEQQQQQQKGDDMQPAKKRRAGGEGRGGGGAEAALDREAGGAAREPLLYSALVPVPPVGGRGVHGVAPAAASVGSSSSSSRRIHGAETGSGGGAGGSGADAAAAASADKQHIRAPHALPAEHAEEGGRAKAQAAGAAAPRQTDGQEVQKAKRKGKHGGTVDKRQGKEEEPGNKAAGDAGGGGGGGAAAAAREVVGRSGAVASSEAAAGIGAEAEAAGGNDTRTKVKASKGHEDKGRASKKHGGVGDNEASLEATAHRAPQRKARGGSSKKWYAVTGGTEVGLYKTKAECEAQVKGLGKQAYKAFSTKGEALAHLATARATMDANWHQNKTQDPTAVQGTGGGAVESGGLHELAATLAAGLAWQEKQCGLPAAAHLAAARLEGLEGAAAAPPAPPPPLPHQTGGRGETYVGVLGKRGAAGGRQAPATAKDAKPQSKSQVQAAPKRPKHKQKQELALGAETQGGYGGRGGGGQEDGKAGGDDDDDDDDDDKDKGQAVNTLGLKAEQAAKGKANRAAGTRRGGAAGAATRGGRDSMVQREGGGDGGGGGGGGGDEEMRGGKGKGKRSSTTENKCNIKRSEDKGNKTTSKHATSASQATPVPARLTIREMLADKGLGTPMSTSSGTMKSSKGSSNSSSAMRDKAKGASSAAAGGPAGGGAQAGGGVGGTGDELPDASKVAAPQLRTVGGRIVIDTSSLVISNSTDKSYQFSDLVLDQTGRGANAWSKKRKHCDRWTRQETDKFYLGLQKFGTDFTMLAHWLGNRRDDRRHVRNKFKKEEKVDPARIQRALANRLDAEDDDWAAVRQHSGFAHTQTQGGGGDTADAENNHDQSVGGKQGEEADADGDEAAELEMAADDAPLDDDDEDH